MPGMNDRQSLLLAESSLAFSRSSGPGGQNVNKVNSKVTLTWSPVDSKAMTEPVRARFLAKFRHRLTKDGKLLVVSQRYRDQPRNIDDCIAKLLDMIASVRTPPKVRRPTKPTRGSQERRLDAKKKRSQTKARRRMDFD